MVRRLLAFIEREIRGLHEAAYLLAFFSVLSQALALVRDRTFAHLFGAGPTLDAYFAAFRIPDLVFAILTLFVSSFALVPLLASKNKQEQGALLGSVLALFGVSAIAVTGLLYVAAPFLVPKLIPGFSPEAASNTILLARIMLLQPILLGVSAIIASLVQASRRFVLFAMAPILYNVGIIVGALVLYPIMGIAGLGWGVVIGALLHVSIQALPLLLRREQLSLSWQFVHLAATVRAVVLPSLPRSLALMGTQGLLVAFATIASVVSVGAVSAMSFAFNLQSVPLTIIGVSYASALFPALAALVAAGDMGAFGRELWATVRHVAFWLIPASLMFVVLRAHVVRVVLGSGAFSWDDTRITAAILALFALSLVPQALILIFSRAYYAMGRTVTPIVINVGGSIAAAVLAYWLVQIVGTHPFTTYFIESLLRVGDIPGTAVLMIPFAYTLVMTCCAVLFSLLFARGTASESGVVASLGTSFSASVIGAAMTYAALQTFGPVLQTNTFIGILLQGALAGGVGLVGWVLVLWILKSKELAEVTTLLMSKMAGTLR